MVTDIVVTLEVSATIPTADHTAAVADGAGPKLAYRARRGSRAFWNFFDQSLSSTRLCGVAQLTHKRQRKVQVR
jgi:hypothetical protein